MKKTGAIVFFSKVDKWRVFPGALLENIIAPFSKTTSGTWVYWTS
jgi:hypothetical protein